MVVNQLFIIQPTKELINKILSFYGLTSLKDNSEFTLIDMINHNTLENFKKSKIEISNYYLPCKKDTIFKNLTNKKCITITRQFLKTVDYDIVSKEKWISNKKYLLYKIISKDEKEKLKEARKEKEKKKKNNEIIITFD